MDDEDPSLADDLNEIVYLVLRYLKEGVRWAELVYVYEDALRGVISTANRQRKFLMHKHGYCVYSEGEADRLVDAAVREEVRARRATESS